MFINPRFYCIMSDKERFYIKGGLPMVLLFATVENDYSRDKLEQLYCKYHKLVYHIAYNILKDSHLAQDVVQSVFIKLIDNLDKIDNIDCNKTKAFIVIISRNLSINLYRKRNRQNNIGLENLEEVLPDSRQSIDEKIIGNEVLDWISYNIKKLHEPYADILTLKYFYHYTDKEIAQLLDISHENVRTRLHRARQSLIKLLLEEKGGEVDEQFVNTKT